MTQEQPNTIVRTQSSVDHSFRSFSNQHTRLCLPCPTLIPLLFYSIEQTTCCGKPTTEPKTKIVTLERKLGFLDVWAKNKEGRK